MANLNYGEPGGETRIVPLNDLTLIGRALDCSLSLQDAMASRQHAEVRLVEGEFVLKDLQSKNGTEVNGNPVSTWILKDGDNISIGVSHITYHSQ